MAEERPPEANRHVARTVVAHEGGGIETFRCPGGGAARLCAAHPASAFGPETARLLAEVSGAPTVTVNPRGLGGSSAIDGGSLEQMVDDLEAVRTHLGVPPWVFWGMSGGGFLALLYAHRHPEGLAAIVVESACLCFRERLRDPTCVLSPWFPSWRGVLADRGLLRAADARTAAAERDAGTGAWLEVEGVGAVYRSGAGAVEVVAPMPIDAAMRAAMPRLLGFDARPWAAGLRVPALVLAGSADPVAPLAHVRAVHEALAGSRWLVVEGAGHVPTGEGRPEVAPAVRALLATVR